MLVELSLHNIFNVMKSSLYLHTELQLDLLSYTFIHTTELRFVPCMQPYDMQCVFSDAALLIHKET